MMSMNLSDVAILNIKFSEYRCIIKKKKKNVVITLMQNPDLMEERGTYKA